MSGEKAGGNNRNDRSRWLTSLSNFNCGDYFAMYCKRKRLRLPLDKAIPRKNKALRDAVSRYQMAADYGILEFLTMSSVKIADLYETFAKDLRAVPAPKGLSAEEKTMYKQIIEEQAGPFVDLAVELYESNVSHAWAGKYKYWIKKRYAKIRV